MDNYLYNKVQGHDNLPVPIAMLHSFKRMRHFQPYSAVVDALKQSTFLEVLNDEHDELCVKRKIPLAEEFKDKPKHEIEKVFESQAMVRSVYIKGFGQEEPSTQFDIEAFFAKFGATKSVRLRRTSEKFFKGSVFVEFDSEDTAQSFLKLEPEPKWKGKHLLIKSKKQYCDDKVEDIKAGRIKPHGGEHQQKGTHEGSRSKKDDRGGNRNNKDDRDWRTRRDEDRRNGFKDKGHQRSDGGKSTSSKVSKGGDEHAPDHEKKKQDVEQYVFDLSNVFMF